MSFAEDYLKNVQEVLSLLPADKVTEVTDIIYTAFQNGKQLFMFGNGGSASTASHFANDFQKGAIVEGGKTFRAASLCDSISIMLAWANDSEYANIFEPQVATWVGPGDVVIGISGSGNSENVIRGIKKANELGATTVGLSGMGGGKLAQTAKVNIVVESPNMQKIEDVHTVILHCIYSDFKTRLKAEKSQ